jgi:clathrin interactor 1
MLGGVWKASSEWKFTLTKKIPLLSFSTDDRFIENFVFFLANEDIHIAEELLMELMSVWSTKSHVMDAPFDQHFYVTKLIVLMIKHLPNPKKRAEDIKKLMLNGIQVHLQSSDKKIQSLGMITSETVLGILDADLKDDEKLKFDYSDLDKKVVAEVVDMIRKFPEKAETIETFEEEDAAEVEKAMEELIRLAKGQESELTQAKQSIQEIAQPPQPIKNPPSKVIRKVELDSDDDEDMQPYDDPDDYLRKSDDKRPRYLLDLIQAFTSKEHTEDAEKFELSVTGAEEIIKQQLPSHHSDIGIDLLRIFVSLDKTCYMEQNFEEIKMKVLVRICVIHPKEAAQYLCQEFNTETSAYSMNKRMLMLDVLAEAAKTLSKLEMDKAEETSTAVPVPVQAQNKLMIKLNEELEKRNRSDAQRVIRQRLLAKTRRIATRTKAAYEDSGINRFAEVAGWFFFPLVHGFGRKQMVFKTGTNLKDDVDNLLLVRFLNTVAVMMLCAENSVIAPKMAKEIISLSAFLRFHEEPKIRLAVLHMVATIVLALPKKILASEFPREIDELMNHLGMIVKSSVINYEPDQECREFAKQLLAMFQSVLYSQD